jgi:hypothetical protein
MYSTYEVCRMIRQIVCAAATEPMIYTTWYPEFVTNRLRSVPAHIKRLEKYQPVDPSLLTKTEALDLGFGTWSDDSDLRLIPVWLFPYLVPEFQGGDIADFEGLICVKDHDADHRFGCLAFGVFPVSDDNS